ncbi:MAG: hypothetical protein ACI4R8_03030 [Candidatus Caccovivens sp.]
MINNVKLEIEWNKIKDYNICSYEEFKEIFNKNPFGRCFKKYTNYDWCKDNFFFGDYEDLLKYYKTTSEVPFYLKNKIDTKYGQLTIKDFSYNDKHELVAHCLCDCGNAKNILWTKIQKGKAKSCGCKSKKKKGFSNTSIMAVFPKIVKENWDYEKNSTPPEQVEINSKESYWWKGYNESYLMPVSALKANVVGTSFPEQAILYFLKKNGINALSRQKIDYDNKKYEVDILIPDLKVAIEYDGVVWHKNKKNLEDEKNNAVNKNGIFLIRIRENGLKETRIDNGLEIINDSNIDDIQFLSEAITEIFFTLHKIDNNIHTKVILKRDILEERKHILFQYICGFVENNINKSWLNKFWCKENEVPSYLVSDNSIDKFWFKCNSSKIFISPCELNVALRYSEQENEKEEYKDRLLVKNVCPFSHLSCCPRNCYCFSKEYINHCNFYTGSRTEINNKIINFVNNSVDIDLKRFRDNIITILENEPSHISDILSLYLNKSCLDEEKSFSFMYESFCYPHVRGYKCLSLLFENDQLLNFYFSHYDYKKLYKHTTPFLNLDHSENIFSICYSMIYRKEFYKLEKALDIIHKFSTQTNFDNFIRNLFLQYYTRKSETLYSSTFKNKKNISVFFETLTSKCSYDLKMEITKMLNEDRESFRLNFLIEHMLDLYVSGDLNIEKLETIVSRLDESITRFRPIFMYIRKRLWSVQTISEKVRMNDRKKLQEILHQNKLISDDIHKYIKLPSVQERRYKEIQDNLLKYYNKLNCEVMFIDQSDYQGIDVIVVKGKTKLGIQMKYILKYNFVESMAISEAVNGAKKLLCDKCIVVFDRLSKDSIALATRNGIMIFDQYEFMKKLTLD